MCATEKYICDNKEKIKLVVVVVVVVVADMRSINSIQETIIHFSESTVLRK